MKALLSARVRTDTVQGRPRSSTDKRLRDPLPWLIALALAQTVAWLVVSMSTTIDTGERGALENTQIKLLATGAVILVAAGVRLARGARRLVAFALALVLASCLLREMDPRAVGTFRPLKFLAGDPGILVIGPPWLALLVFAAREARAVIECIRRWLRETSGRAFLAGCAFLLVGWIFDKGLLPLEAGVSQLCEEMAELDGYLMFLASSVAFMIRAGATARSPNARVGHG